MPGESQASMQAAIGQHEHGRDPGVPAPDRYQSYAARSSTYEADRLKLLERLHDPLTVRQLEAIGVAPGWACLEAGSGAGSITRWLADTVGSQGRVEAIDLDPEMTETGGRGNVTVRRADVETGELPQEMFDLIHVRFVLMHTRDPGSVLERLYRALRPGGWLLAEDHDTLWMDLEEWPGYPGAVQEAAARVWRAQAALLERSGATLRMGRTLPRLMYRLGLEQLAGESWSPIGSAAYMEWMQMTLDMSSGPLVRAGGCTHADLDLLRTAAGTGSYQGLLTMSVRGRKTP